MKTYSYDIFVNLDVDHLLFLNRILQYPGIDYIVKSRGLYDGVSLVFKRPLANGDVLVLQRNDEVYYFKADKICKKIELIDEMNDHRRYERWIDNEEKS